MTAKRRFWQFHLATWLSFFLFCSAIAAVLRLRFDLATVSLGEATAVDLSGLIYLLAGLIGCVAAASMALSQSTVRAQERLLRGAIGGAIGGCTFALATRYLVGIDPFNATSPVPAAISLLWWALCGTFVGLAVELLGYGWRNRHQVDLTRQSGDAEDTAVEVLSIDGKNQLSRWSQWLRERKKEVPGWLTSLFLHASALFLLLVGLIQLIERPFEQPRENIMSLELSTTRAEKQRIILPLKVNAIVKVDPPKPKQKIAAKPRRRTPSPKLFPVRRGSDAFRFFMFSPKKLEMLNQLGESADRTPKTGEQVVVAISAAKQPNVTKVRHMLVRVSNTGKVALSGVFVFFHIEGSSVLRGVSFGGIQPILKASPPSFVPFRRSNGTVRPGLIGVDETNNRVVYNAEPLVPGQWVQFQVVVEFGESRRFKAKVSVICAGGARGGDSKVFVAGS